jgi:hypothetical protein
MSELFHPRGAISGSTPGNTVRSPVDFQTQIPGSFSAVYADIEWIGLRSKCRTGCLASEVKDVIIRQLPSRNVSNQVANPKNVRLILQAVHEKAVEKPKEIETANVV